MLKKVAHEGGCWVWQGALTPDGYPRVGRNGNPNIRGHRYFFDQVKGEIPEGQVIRHTCDNTRCINPDHLVLGTVDQNVQDRTDRARTANHKTDEQIEQILELRSTTDLPQWRVAEIVGCSQAYVSKVGRGIYKRLIK